MSLASDLMGLGLPPFLASKIASGGTGPLTLAGAGTNFATATKIGAQQYLVSVSTAASGSGLALPIVGGDNGALLADDFVINNLVGNTLMLFAPAGVSVSVYGTNTSLVSMTQHTSLTLYPVSKTQWIGVGGS